MTPSMVRGNTNPTMMSHTKPGNRVSGTRKSAWGISKFNQLNTPQMPSAIPQITSHFGSSFENAAGTAMPAMSNPNGTEKPDPPSA